MDNRPGALGGLAQAQNLTALQVGETALPGLYFKAGAYLRAYHCSLAGSQVAADEIQHNQDLFDMRFGLWRQAAEQRRRAGGQAGVEAFPSVENLVANQQDGGQQAAMADAIRQALGKLLIRWRVERFADWVLYQSHHLLRGEGNGRAG